MFSLAAVVIITSYTLTDLPFPVNYTAFPIQGRGNFLILRLLRVSDGWVFGYHLTCHLEDAFGQLAGVHGLVSML